MISETLEIDISVPVSTVKIKYCKQALSKNGNYICQNGQIAIITFPLTFSWISYKYGEDMNVSFLTKPFGK